MNNAKVRQRLHTSDEFVSVRHAKLHELVEDHNEILQRGLVNIEACSTQDISSIVDVLNHRSLHFLVFVRVHSLSSKRGREELQGPTKVCVGRTFEFDKVFEDGQKHEQRVRPGKRRKLKREEVSFAELGPICSGIVTEVRSKHVDVRVELLFRLLGSRRG